MKQALQEKSISPCLVDDYRYLNKGIPNFFDYKKVKADESEKGYEKRHKANAIPM